MTFSTPTSSHPNPLHITTTTSDNSRNRILDKQLCPPSSAPPDGGTLAWLTIAGAWMIQFCTFGYLNAFGVYQDYYSRDFLSHESPSNISWIGSIQLFLMYVPAVFVGHLFDAGYFHHVQISGSVLLVFSIFMLSLTQEGQYYQVFLAQGIGVGLSVGVLFLPSLSIVSHHFRIRRALATGIVVSGASCGGIVFPIMLNHLFANPKMGFPNGVRFSGALIAALLALANCIMRTRLAPKRRSLRAVFSPQSLKHIAGDGPYMWSIAGAFCANLGLFVPFFYLQLFAADHNVNATVTAYILTILNAGSTLGRTLPVALADSAGVYPLLLPALLASAALLFALFGATSTAGVTIVAVLFGFSSGAYISLIPPLLGTLCMDLSELGLRMGLAFTLVGLSMLVGTPIFGALLNTGFSSGSSLVWWKALVFAGVCILVGFVFMAGSWTLFGRRLRRARAPTSVPDTDTEPDMRAVASASASSPCAVA